MKLREIRLVLACTALIATVMACEPAEKPVPEILPPPPTAVPDTAFPGSYYPVYPGSFWEYTINGQPGLRDTTSATYLPHSYVSHYNQGQAVYSDTVYVPFLNGRPIYGYSKIEQPPPIFSMTGEKFWPILSETVGFSFTEGWIDTRFGDHNEYLKVVSKDVQGSDSVITIRGHRVYGLTQNVSTRKYVKGVGLSLWIIVDTTANDTFFRQELINYFINQ